MYEVELGSQRYILDFTDKGNVPTMILKSMGLAYGFPTKFHPSGLIEDAGLASAGTLCVKVKG